MEKFLVLESPSSMERIIYKRNGQFVSELYEAPVAREKCLTSKEEVKEALAWSIAADCFNEIRVIKLKRD